MSGTAVTVVIGASRFPAKLGPPDSTSVQFLDPPSGLGRQTPAVSKIALCVSTEVLDLVAEGTDSTTDIVLIDIKGETPCLAIEAQAADDEVFGNSYLMLAARHFYDWALREGRLVYKENYSHTWERHPT